MKVNESFKNKVFISVVSHDHSKLIARLNVLKKLSNDENVIVLIKNNKKDELIYDYIKGSNIHLIDQDYNNGFGYNNNLVFNYCSEKLGMQEGDYFLVVNPDLIINLENIKNLVKKMETDKVSISTINLFKDEVFTIPDSSVRKFPGLYDFFSSFILKTNNTFIDKASIIKPVAIDWCAGSFIAFKVTAYKALQGFNTRYFMYCEDVDICYRAKKMNIPIIYYPDIIACHLAQHNNRKILSKHFFWHLRSALYFLLSKRVGLKSKSNVVV